LNEAVPEIKIGKGTRCSTIEVFSVTFS
jgi:hypothetical protein